MRTLLAALATLALSLVVLTGVAPAHASPLSAARTTLTIDEAKPEVVHYRRRHRRHFRYYGYRPYRHYYYQPYYYRPYYYGYYPRRRHFGLSLHFGPRFRHHY